MLIADIGEQALPSGVWPGSTMQMEAPKPLV